MQFNLVFKKRPDSSLCFGLFVKLRKEAERNKRSVEENMKLHNMC